ncbi:regulatory protein RecX [uncultured Tenacibaculum sp.]|uniref:regulatory protein RecX n=1 Tax=uncultured Tenacibaculum sp. TaxID=174713 RepID=UPI00260CA205|nr:regulatory protein RecX [uncultured Tenacibaculum sp.]
MKKQVTSIEEVKRKIERYCVYQDRCHKEVEKKLAEYHLIPEAKEAILLHLFEHNFLNEERFAKSFARGKFRIKKWGRQRITRELKLRDISTYNIKTALKEINETDYLTSLHSLIEKKNNQVTEENIFKRKKKIIDFLLYRGYETDLVFKTVNELIA